MNDPRHEPAAPPRKPFNLPSTIALLLVAVLVFAVPFLFVGKGKDIVPWRTDLSAATKEAAASGKLLMLDFTADWCGPCQTMKRTTFADESVKAALEKDFIPVKIDLSDRNKPHDVARRFNISAVPTLIVMDAGGKTLARDSGAMPSGQFLAWLQRAKAAADGS